MKPIRSQQALKILRDAYGSESGNEKVSRNYHLRKEQDVMLDLLAESFHETKVTVLRSIIDEWREMKLGDCDEG